jgi:hypothetical protein
MEHLTQTGDFFGNQWEVPSDVGVGGHEVARFGTGGFNQFEIFNGFHTEVRET